MKTTAQINRMKYRNQVDYFEDWFADTRRVTSEFGACSFKELAAQFREFALASFPAYEKQIEAAILNAKTFLREGSEPALRLTVKETAEMVSVIEINGEDSTATIMSGNGTVATHPFDFFMEYSA